MEPPKIPNSKISILSKIRGRIYQRITSYLYFKWPSLWWSSRSSRYYENKAGSEEIKSRANARHQRLIEKLGLLEWDSMLEVGCGFGWNLHSFQSKNPNKVFHGCDFSTNQISQAEKLYSQKIKFDIADAQSLPYADGSFDIVITITCFQHVPPNHIEKAMKEIQRVSKRHILLLEMDSEFATKDEIEEQLNSRVAFWHNYSSMVNTNFVTAFHEDWSDFNNRVEPISLHVYSKVDENL